MIKSSHERGVQIIELSRPDKKNAFTGAMYHQLRESLVAADAAIRLTQLPQAAVLRTKALLKHPDEVLGRINLEAEAFVMRAKSSAAQEAFAAFVEKRKPNFAGLD